MVWAKKENITIAEKLEDSATYDRRIKHADRPALQVTSTARTQTRWTEDVLARNVATGMISNLICRSNEQNGDATKHGHTKRNTWVSRISRCDHGIQPSRRRRRRSIRATDRHVFSFPLPLDKPSPPWRHQLRRLPLKPTPFSPRHLRVC